MLSQQSLEKGTIETVNLARNCCSRLKRCHSNHGCVLASHRKWSTERILCFGFWTKRFTGISAHHLIDTRRGYLIRLPFALCFPSFPNFSSIPHSPASFISLKPSGMTEHTSTAVQIFFNSRKAEERGEGIGLGGWLFDERGAPVMRTFPRGFSYMGADSRTDIPW